MSAITIGGDLIHYEKLGRGRPVILLHGWIGAWIYWVPLMQQLHLKYSVYTLDLLGFGDSAKNPEKYTITAQVEMLEKFMDQLGITKAAFIGHGLGAMVAAEFALKNPDKSARMILTSLPLFDPGDLDTRSPAGQSVRLQAPPMQNPSNSTIPVIAPTNDNTSPDATLMRTPLKDTGASNDSTTVPSNMNNMPTIGRITADDRRALLEAATERNANRDDRIQLPMDDEALTASGHNPLVDVMRNRTALWLLEKCFKRSEAEFDKLKVHVDKSDSRALINSTQDFDAGRMLDKLRLIEAPILMIHGADDPIISAPNEEVWNYLTIFKDDTRVAIPLPDVRHFPMLEYTPYARLVMDFLNSADISKLQIRERWVRRSY